MKKIVALMLCLVIVWGVVPRAQTGPHFETTVLSQSGVQAGIGSNGVGDETIMRHSTTNGGYAIIGTHANYFDDGFDFDTEVWGYVNVYGSDWTFGWQDTFWASTSGYRWDNGDGTSTIYKCLVYGIDDSGGVDAGCHYLYELNSKLAAAQTMSAQAIMSQLDGCQCGNTSDATQPASKSWLAKLLDYFFPTAYAWTVNWRCVWLAATDPICDEMEVIFPGAGLGCMIVMYELCTQVENLGPGGKGHALNRTPL